MFKAELTRITEVTDVIVDEPKWRDWAQLGGRREAAQGDRRGPHPVRQPRSGIAAKEAGRLTFVQGPTSAKPDFKQV